MPNLNINSVRNKFDQLKSTIYENFDILIIAETKIDDSFPDAQFKLMVMLSFIGLYRNSNGGGLLIYVGEDIPQQTINLTCFSE